MDINATFREMVRSFASGEYADALELADAGLSWLSRGGYPPIGHTRKSAPALCRKILAHSIDAIKSEFRTLSIGH